jgi:hypothetical protein
MPLFHVYNYTKNTDQTAGLKQKKQKKIKKKRERKKNSSTSESGKSGFVEELKTCFSLREIA